MWTISFLSNLGKIEELKVSTDDAETFAKSASGNTLMGTSARIVVSTSVEGLRGFDQQTVLTASGSADMAGKFALSIDGKSTSWMEHNVSLLRSFVCHRFTDVLIRAQNHLGQFLPLMRCISPESLAVELTFQVNVHGAFPGKANTAV